jgi:hypothetical protein
MVQVRGNGFCKSKGKIMDIVWSLVKHFIPELEGRGREGRKKRRRKTGREREREREKKKKTGPDFN